MTPPPSPGSLEVTCALIPRQGRLLWAQRAENGLWELPGGKAEPGETLPACLAREINEELGATVQVGSLLARQEGFTPQGAPMRLHAFACRLTQGEPRAREHLALAWLRPAEVEGLVLCPTDRDLWQSLQASGALDNSSTWW